AVKLNAMNHTNSTTAGLILSLFSALIALGLVVPVMAQQLPAVERLSGESSGPVVRGTWVWQEKWINTDQAQDEMLDFCGRFGFNLILIQIHNDREAQGYTIKYPAELTRLVAEAAKRGIAVEALDGANDMAFAANQPKTLEMLDALIDLNQSMPEGARFTGVHYDIEPYTSDRWKAGQAERDAVMAELLDFYVKARQKLNDRGSKMTLACDIPMWYDAKTAENDHCIVTFNGERKNLHEHIQDLCDYIGIMSYRRFAVGKNSVTYHVQNEMGYADGVGRGVCAGVETGKTTADPTESATISFYGIPSDVFWSEVGKVHETFKDRPAYRGVLIHCYARFQEYLADNPPKGE
ncbi:MAG: hypothetical protein R3C45_22460, partial [Phycisphaerales bacterium]